MSKYELTTESKINKRGVELFRIRALVSFADVEAGDLGGWVAGIWNLNQYDRSWIYDNAEVYDDAEVYDYATIRDNARVCGSATVCDHATVRGNALVCNNATIEGKANIYDNAVVGDQAVVDDHVEVFENAFVGEMIFVRGEADIRGDAEVWRDFDYATIKGFGTNQSIIMNRITITAFRCGDGSIKISHRTFIGTLSEFRTHVKDTMNGKIAEECLIVADLMEKHFGEDRKTHD